MRVAVYGGSFNPPHVGHAMVASWVRWTERADEVWLLPAFRHAFDKALAPWPERLEMAHALAHILGPWVRVEPIEAALPVPSYTIRTLEALQARHPTVEFQLVIGADVLGQLPLWRESQRLQERFPFLVVGRQGYPPTPGAPCFPDVSSTEIRARVASGEPIDHLVPRVIADLIAKGGLYRRAPG